MWWNTIYEVRREKLDILDIIVIKGVLRGEGARGSARKARFPRD